MMGSQPDHDGLDMVLEDIRKNIRDNHQFLDLLKNDQDMDLPADDEKQDYAAEYFEEL